MSKEEVKEFIRLAESKIDEKDGLEKERQKSFVRGMKSIFNMIYKP